MLEIIPEGHWRCSASDPQLIAKMLNLDGMEVDSVERDPDKEAFYFNLFHSVHTANCPTCSKSSRLIHESKPRTVRDLHAHGFACYLQFAARRFYCKECRLPFTETLGWLPPCGRLTHRFREHLFEECRQTSLKAVAERERIGCKTLERLYYALADRQIRQSQKSLVSRLGVDEISLLKGHGHFVLMIYDLDKGKVIDVLPDRKKETLQQYLKSWSQDRRDAVTEVSMDLWEPYALAVRECLPQAKIVADRFHVTKLLTEQVGLCRREIQRNLSDDEKKEFKDCRWLLVRNEKDLSGEEKSRLGIIFKKAPSLETLHTLKEEFRSIYESEHTLETAGNELRLWINRVKESGLKKLDRFLGTLHSRWDDILNYFNTRLTNGTGEGLNNKSKVIKRTAYGYRNVEHFSARILIECDGR